MKTAEHIIETVDKLVRKYHTRDPYELCQLLNITVIGFACRRSGLNVSSFPSAVFPFVNIFSFSCHKVHLLQYDYNSDGKL